MGRVHRGTPWQTAFLKATAIDTNLWAIWTGHTNIWTQWTSDTNMWHEWASWNSTNNPHLPWPGESNVVDASFSHPIRDRQLLDLFTAGLNDNAMRGRLSINQTNLAAWSAVLSGVIAITNTSTTGDLGGTPPVLNYEPVILQPAGTYTANQMPPLAQIVTNINSTRANPTNFPDRLFRQVGDVLAAPLLTERSLYLSLTNLNMPTTAGGISDPVMERIPEQILGLLGLDHAPRFVIYSYGQTLKPAERSVVLTSGPFFGLCTNYQITAEVATRAVLRAEPHVVSGVEVNRNTSPWTTNYFSRTNYSVVTEQFNVLPPD